ncbi:MAG: glycerol-3-phosphate 1-O-acyltransferase [Cytophagales bacterium]|nr:MAG: glycerol-3-phosphate 1-O-acyltransferase [Cytophagales bacterium]
MNIELLIGVISCYIIGSIPTAVIYGKFFHNIDVRNHGSGNAGATNTLRTLGKTAGFVVMLFDVFKGWMATELASGLIYFDAINPNQLMLFKILFGIIAVVGHIFPVFAKFKGGKGIACLLGMILNINIEIALICIGVFIVVFLLSRYVSLGSMIATLAFPIVIILFPRFNDGGPMVIVFAFAIFTIVVLTHQKNIIRLINGEENKTRLGRKN